MPSRHRLCPINFIWLPLFVYFLFSTSDSSRANEVLIFYANETSPSGLESTNYETFITWLHQIDTEKSRTIARALERDASDFPEAVAAEVTVISDAILEGRINSSLVLFTNELARQGKFLVVSPTAGSRQESIEISPTSSLVLTGNPLSRSEVLETALTRVSEVFPADEYEYVLITKSHGSLEFALTPRLHRDFRDWNLEKLRQSLGDDQPELLETFGITKQELFAAIERAGQLHHMTFKLIFIESCRGVFDSTTIERFPSNVERLYASGDRYLQYQTLDYELAVDEARELGSLREPIDRQLRTKYLAIFRSPSRTSYWSWAWFMPLLVALGYWVNKTWKKRAHSQKTMPSN